MLPNHDIVDFEEDKIEKKQERDQLVKKIGPIEQGQKNRRKAMLIFIIITIILIFGIIICSVLLGVGYKHAAILIVLVMSVPFALCSFIFGLLFRIYSRNFNNKIEKFYLKPTLAYWKCSDDEWQIYVEEEYGRNGRRRDRDTCALILRCMIYGFIGAIKSILLSMRSYDDLEEHAKSTGIPVYVFLIMIFVGGFVFCSFIIRFGVFIMDEISYIKAKQAVAETIIIANGIKFGDKLMLWGETRDQNFNYLIVRKCDCKFQFYECLQSVEVIPHMNILMIGIFHNPKNPELKYINIPIPNGKMDDAFRVERLLSECC